MGNSCCVPADKKPQDKQGIQAANELAAPVATNLITSAPTQMSAMPVALAPVDLKTPKPCRELPPFQRDPELDKQFANLPSQGLVQLGGGKYIGQMKDGNRHGYGRFWFADGAYVEGYWVNNRLNYKARLIHSKGDVYDGEWKDDSANGYGTYYNSDGSTYEGQWKDDMQHGRGKETWPDGVMLNKKISNADGI